VKLGPAEVLTEQEIRRLLAAFSRKAPTGVRNRALVLLLWRSGLRVSEALALDVGDLGQETLRVRESKTGRPRVVGLHQEAAQAIEIWRAHRLALSLERYRPVFCTLQGRRVSRRYVGAMLERKARAAGLSELRVHPHAFRATLAVELAREGVPLPAIREVLGHTNLASTDAYLRRVFPQQAITAILDRAGAGEPINEQLRRWAQSPNRATNYVQRDAERQVKQQIAAAIQPKEGTTP
jgi:site-specific recombinase XerD